MMDETAIANHILTTFAGVETDTNFDYTFFYYGAERKLPFATIASTGNQYEQVSQLDRPGVFRLNIGVSKQTFQSLFGKNPVELTAFDFTALDTLMPHPHYAAQNYVCVLNPSDATFKTVESLLAEAYALAVTRETKRQARKTSA